MDLREYQQAKFVLAEALRTAQAHSPNASGDGVEDSFRDLFERLAEDRFNLVVIGQFSRGKSTLMNAIMGTERLPTGIVPLTSVITTVSYGSQEKVALKYRGRRLDTEIAIEELPQYITQAGNPGNKLGIAEARIELPSEILRRGFHFIDTPGLGSAIGENTQTTEAFLPQADAIMLVTSYESPLSEEESRLLRIVGHSGLRVFIALNKSDLASPEERSGAVDFVRQKMREAFGEPEPEISSLSARDALEARQSGNEAGLQKSGLAELEKRLVTFLLEQKRSDFLARIYDRVSQLVRRIPLSGQRVRIFEQLQTLKEELEEPTAAIPRTKTAPSLPAGLQQLQSCEICKEISDVVWHFLSRYQYRLATDPLEQKRFARRGGFCPTHHWEYQSLASPYGVCAGHPPLLDQMAAQLREAGGSSSKTSQSATEMLEATRADCILCEVRDAAEAKAVDAMAARFQVEGAKTLDSLSAICLPHLAMLIRSMDEPAEIAALLARQAMLLERISEDMRQFTLKHDAVKRSLETHEEETATRRALLLLAGRRNINVGIQAAIPVMDGLSRNWLHAVRS
jgi:small GTP-binding protein